MAEKQTFTFGLTEIIVGDVMENGKMPYLEDMTKIGKVSKGTANMTMDPGESNDIYEESNPTPVLSIEDADKAEFNFQILDVTPELITEYMGGEKVGSSTMVGFLGKTVSVEKSFIFKPKQGLYFTIPKASVKATFGGDFSTTGVLTMTCVVKPLSPDKGGASVFCDYLSNFETNFPAKTAG